MLELNTLYNMDCMEGMKQFPDGYFEDWKKLNKQYNVFLLHYI